MMDGREQVVRWMLTVSVGFMMTQACPFSNALTEGIEVKITKA